MGREQTDSITKLIDNLPFEEKQLVYKSSFSLGYLNTSDLNDRLVLISLVALVNQRMKLKEPTITPLKVLTRITGQKEDTSGFYQFLVALAIAVDDLSYGIQNIDACGFKTSQEIINKIKELLNTWLPF